MNSDNKPKGKLSISSEVLQRLFENGKTPLSEQFLRWKLWAKWEEVVGSTIASHAEPVSFQRGVLYVWVRNSAWLHQMTFMNTHIRDTINQKFQNNFVKSIRFTLDRHAVPQDDQGKFKEMIAKIAPEGDDE